MNGVSHLAVGALMRPDLSHPPSIFQIGWPIRLSEAQRRCDHSSLRVLLLVSPAPFTSQSLNAYRRRLCVGWPSSSRSLCEAAQQLRMASYPRLCLSHACVCPFLHTFVSVLSTVITWQLWVRRLCQNAVGSAPAKARAGVQRTMSSRQMRMCKLLYKLFLRLMEWLPCQQNLQHHQHQRSQCSPENPNEVGGPQRSQSTAKACLSLA